MKKRIRSILALLLAALMTLTLLPMASAAEPAERRGDAPGEFVYVNPFYRRTHTDAELEADLAQARSDALPTRSTPHYTTFSGAAKYIRSQMVARNGSFVFTVSSSVSAPGGQDLTNALVEKAMEHTESCTGQEGDALRWQIGWCYCSQYETLSDGKIKLTYTAMYYTTAAQETALTKEVNSAMTSLKLSGKTERQKIRAIYDYICDRVNYDYDHMNDQNYLLQYTAYAAMHNKTAVCQGYAVLFYRMCKEAGLDVRVVTSYDHAWNIVRIGDYYYNVDATWDGGDDETYHDWYLKGMREFPDHYREPPYDTEEFDVAYPMVADPDLNAANLARRFTSVKGKTVSSAASSGRPKILFFTDLGASEVDRDVLKALGDFDLTEVDVVAVDTAGSDKDTVKEIGLDLGCGAMTVCYGASTDVIFEFLDRCGCEANEYYYPIIIYIDGNNRIQDYSVGPVSGYTMGRSAADHLGLTLTYGKPRISRQPKDFDVYETDMVEFRVTANARGGVSYQWYYRTSPEGSWIKSTLPGCRSESMSVTAKLSRSGYQYRCKITSSYGTRYSRVATLNVSRYDLGIIEQPRDVSAPIGAEAVFHIEVKGNNPTYQWAYNSPDMEGDYVWQFLSGERSDTLTVPVTAAKNGWRYRCFVGLRGEEDGETMSDVATLTVATEITSQPADRCVPAGDTAKFTVKATGVDLTYQWQYKSAGGSGWSNCSMTGSRTKTLSVPVTNARNGYQYRCKITDGNGAVTCSEPAVLTVKTVITSQPADASVPMGDSARFTVAAAGVGLTYQWQYKTAGGTAWNNCSMEGNQTPSLTVPVTAARNGYKYRCVITDANGKKTYSSAAVLTVATVITSQPQDVTAAAGESAVFTVEASGVGLTYQWQYKTAGGTAWNNCTMEGNQTPSLTVPVTNARSGYQYRCKITDGNGAVTNSDPALLTVE